MFGFLSPGEAGDTKNFGLKDVNKALKWIKRNILYFGGDPNRITLMGEGTGAAVVQLEMLGDSSSVDLFHRVIVIGSSIRAPGMVQRKPKENFQYLLSVIKTKSSCGSEDTLDILRGVSAKDLVVASEKIMESRRSLFPIFQPVVTDEIVFKMRKRKPILYIVNGEMDIFREVTKDVKDLLPYFDDNLISLLNVSPRELSEIKKIYFNNYPNEQNILNITNVSKIMFKFYFAHLFNLINFISGADGLHLL